MRWQKETTIVGYVHTHACHSVHFLSGPTYHCVEPPLQEHPLHSQAYPASSHTDVLEGVVCKCSASLDLIDYSISKRIMQAYSLCLCYSKSERLWEWEGLSVLHSMVRGGGVLQASPHLCGAISAQPSFAIAQK